MSVGQINCFLEIKVGAYFAQLFFATNIIHFVISLHED